MFRRKNFSPKDVCSLWARLSIVAAIGMVLTACEAGFGRSGNTELSRLTLRNATLEPAFRSEEQEYEARVARTVTSVVFNATPEAEESTMTLNGVDLPRDTDVSRSLALGPNTFDIEVTAENEFTRTYRIVITRDRSSNNNAFLDAFSLENVAFDFDRDDLDYTSSVNFFVNSTQAVTTKAEDLATSRLTIGMDADPSTGEVLGNTRPSSAIPLADGETTDINVTVTSSDLTTTRAYSVAVSRSMSVMLGTTLLDKADEPETSDRFGDALALDGDTLAIGAPGRDLTESGGESAGAVYIFTRTSNVWTQRQILTPTDLEEGDLFGASVALNGDVLIVGAPGANNSNGEVHLFNRTATDQWEFDETLSPAEGSTSSEYGTSVDMTSEFILVGAPGASSEQGAVYVLIPDNSTWQLEQTLPSPSNAGGDRFGQVVQFNVDQTEMELPASAPGSAGSGAVFIFQRDSDDNDWSETAEVVPSVRDSGDNFGWSMSILRGRLAVGAPGEDSVEVGVDPNVAEDNDATDSGAAYVFTRTQQGQEWTIGRFFKATQSSSGMAFGSTIALSANMLAVGAPMEDGASEGITTTDDNLGVDNSGAVYVFENTAADWAFRIYSKATNTDENDAFGNAITFVGEDLLIGAPNEDTTQLESGAVYIVR